VLAVSIPSAVSRAIEPNSIAPFSESSRSSLSVRAALIVASAGPTSLSPGATPNAALKR